MSNWIGQSVSRVEDERLLKGQGRYLADVKTPGTLEAVFVRSIRSHAAIRGIDKQRALAAPGVVAVFTHKDIAGRTEPICVAGEVHTPERLLIGDSHRQHEIAAELWLHQRGFGLERRDRVGDCRQLLVIDFDQLDRVERLRQRFSDYHG